MKSVFKIILVLSLVILTSGCIVVSLNPLYDSEKELVSDPAIVGTWSSDEKDTYTFAEDGKNQYTCTITSDSIANNFEVHMVQLGKYRFLDVFPKDLSEEQKVMNLSYRLHLVPVHSFSKAWIENDQLYVSLLSLDWLKKQIEQKKVTIPHEEVNGIIVLTAPTKELQKFILKYANDTAAFEIPTEGMKRIK